MIYEVPPRTTIRSSHYPYIPPDEIPICECSHLLYSHLLPYSKTRPPSPQITKNTTIPTFGFRIEYIERIMLYAYARLVSETNTSHHPMKSVRRLNRHRLVSRSGDIDGKLARDIILIGIPTTVINLAALWKF